MKKISTYIVLVFVSIFVINCKPKLPKTDKEILQKAYQTLMDLESVEFDSEVEFYNTTQPNATNKNGHCYLDYRKQNNMSLLGRYYISSNTHNYIWDDNSYTLIDNTQKSYFVGIKEHASKNIFINTSFVTAKNYFPTLLSSDSLLNSTKVIIGEKDITIEFKMINGWINSDNITSFKDTIKNLRIYSYIIDKESYLPKSFAVKYGNNLQSYTKNSFSNLIINDPKSDTIWNLQLYYKNYTQEQNNRKPLIKVGETAPNWTLPSVSGDSVTLSNLHGKLVFLDFYFNNCGACIEALPQMNALYEKYKNRNIKFFAINFADNLPEIQLQLAKTPINYTVLYNAKARVAPSYNIYRAPTYLLIDKDGKIVYAQNGTNLNELANAINKYL